MKKIILVIGMMVQLVGLAKADVVTFDYCPNDLFTDDHMEHVSMVSVRDGAEENFVDHYQNSRISCNDMSQQALQMNNVNPNYAGYLEYYLGKDTDNGQSYLFDQISNQKYSIRTFSDCLNILNLMKGDMNSGYSIQVDTGRKFTISVKKNPVVQCSTKVGN